MKKYELIKVNKDLLKVISDNDIRVADALFIEVYEDFVKKRKTLKFSATITELAEKYIKSERTISRMTAKLQEDLII